MRSVAETTLPYADHAIIAWVITPYTMCVNLSLALVPLRLRAQVRTQYEPSTRNTLVTRGTSHYYLEARHWSLEAATRLVSRGRY